MGEGEWCRTQTLFCFCFVARKNLLLYFVFSYEAWTMCCFDYFLFFLQTFENRLLIILFCNVQRTKLFVDSGVNLGGNDSLFSTGGKNSALQTKIWQNSIIRNQRERGAYWNLLGPDNNIEFFEHSMNTLLKNHSTET